MIMVNNLTFTKTIMKLLRENLYFTAIRSGMARGWQPHNIYYVAY